MRFDLKINGDRRRVDVEPDTPLLWVLRDELRLTGTKFGCGVAQCGACTVHLGGRTARSCVLPVSAVGEREVVTIEGLDGPAAAAVQSAWRSLDVPQCGFCQSGQVMTATALIEQIPRPSDDDVDAAMNGNVCRCNTYVRVRAAVHDAARRLAPIPHQVSSREGASVVQDWARVGKASGAGATQPYSTYCEARKRRITQQTQVATHSQQKAGEKWGLGEGPSDG